MRPFSEKAAPGYRTMRFSFVYVFLLALVAGACTPITPNKAATNGKCNTNSDCQSGACKGNVCVAAVDCNDAANVAAPYCMDRVCNVDTDCPNNFSCAAGICVAGGASGCTDDDACANNDDGAFCLVQSETDTRANRCVECLKEADCGDRTKTCDKTKYTCETKMGCRKDSECKEADPARPLCNTQSGACVECRGTDSVYCNAIGKTNQVCRKNVCVPLDTTDCTQPGQGCDATPRTPVCDANTKQCAACDTGAHLCPANTECQMDGSCKPTGSTTNFCDTNSQCTNKGKTTDGKLEAGVNGGLLIPASIENSNAFYICDSALTPTACVECDPAEATQCGAGFTCQTVTDAGQPPRNVCVTTGATKCTSPSECDEGQACEAGVCALSCKGTSGPNNCAAPRVCSPTGSCDVPTTCQNTAQCETKGLPGYACVANTCQPCSTNAQCSTSGQSLTSCELNRCINKTIPPTKKKLGATCSSGEQCESGVCIDFDLQSSSNVIGPICTAACSRTKTTSNDAPNDCPTAPDATVVAERSLSATQGFGCYIPRAGELISEGAGFCLHARDYRLWAGRSSVPASAFTVPSGNPPSGSNGLTCQSGTASNINMQSVCDYPCMTTADCVATAGVDTVCQEINSTQSGSFVSTGQRFCRVPADNTNAAGDFCERASDCQEAFCDGRVIADFVQANPAKACTRTTECTAGQLCIDGQCHVSTRRATPTSCANNADCRVAGTPGTSTDECWGGRCYAALARTNPDRACQDSGSVAIANLEHCYGRCATHCTKPEDCAADKAGQPGYVCNYRPARPGYDAQTSAYVDGDFAGDGFTRVCTAQATPPAGSEINHVLELGAICTADTECKSEVCVKANPAVLTGVCSTYCARPTDCPMGQVCAFETRSVDPSSDAPVLSLVPVCENL
jgi:hypothetical protein